MKLRSALVAAVLVMAGPAAAAPPDRVFVVFFTDNSAELDDPASAIVTHAAEIAKQFPDEPVHVSGYADQPDSPQVNIDLSRQRADTVANLLVQDGVAAERIMREAVGTPPNSEPGVERRRVEIDIGS